MKTKPFFSIIITVLNGERTMRSCLDSIERQSFRDVEVVIVDGGSSDSTLSIVNSSSVQKLVNVTAGCGLYEGLNIGVSLSKGHWLYFMGADDKLYDKNVLDKVANVIRTQAKQSKLIFGKVYCQTQKELIAPKPGSPYLMRYSVHHQGIFYDRHLFKDLSYDEHRRVASDYELNLKLRLLNTSYFTTNDTFCLFEGNGTSEKQLGLRNEEIWQVHKQLFGRVTSYLVNGLFVIRTKTGFYLRQHNLKSIRSLLKTIFN